jgi:hypothetical protein
MWVRLQISNSQLIPLNANTKDSRSTQIPLSVTSITTIFLLSYTHIMTISFDLERNGRLALGGSAYLQRPST